VFLFSYLLYLWIGTKREAEEYLHKLERKMERENSMNTLPSPNAHAISMRLAGVPDVYQYP